MNRCLISDQTCSPAGSLGVCTRCDQNEMTMSYTGIFVQTKGWGYLSNGYLACTGTCTRGTGARRSRVDEA
jgi:hypothetical protein